MIRAFSLIFLFFCSSSFVWAQITIKGKITDQNNSTVSYAIVSSKVENKAVSTDIDGNYSIKVKNTDTLLISSLGYHLKKVAVSAEKDQILNIVLTSKPYEIRTVSVIAPRSYEEVKKDIKNIKPHQYEVTGFEAVQSPITFLYERFSKFERSKRLVAELENEDRRREGMKELLSHYVSKDIIKLSEEEFDSFISYCRLSDEFIINSTEYELVTAIKDKYKKFVKLNDFGR